MLAAQKRLFVRLCPAAPLGISDPSCYLDLICLGSAWRPAALRLTGIIYPVPAAAYRAPRETSPPRRVRPIVLANAAAAALVIMSLLAFPADPLPL